MAVRGLIGAGLLVVTLWGTPAAAQCTSASHIAQLLASGDVVDDHLGYAIAFDRDTAVVGAPGDRAIGSPFAAGAAYVFTRAGGVWTQQAELTPPGTTWPDGFGRSVAISGDTIAVATGGGPVIGGRVVVFVRSGGSWTQQAVLAGEVVAVSGNDGTGLSVALSGDTLAIGAPYDDIPSVIPPGTAVVDAGGVEIYTRTDPTWTLQATLRASDAAANDHFGASVAMAINRVIVGAPGDDTPAAGPDSGSAHIFARFGTEWSPQPPLEPSDGAPENHFGSSVAISGDTAVVGAIAGDGVVTANVGAAYVFVTPGSLWSQQAKLLASDGALNGYFGGSVAIDGGTVVVGASGDNTAGGTDAGSAYVFVRSGTLWTQQKRLSAADGAASDSFGVSVAIDGDTAMVGAYLDDTPGGTNAGSAYVFTRSRTTWTPQAKLTAADGAAYDLFGHAVAVDGDTAVIGAYGEDTPAGSNAGAAYVFTRAGSVWSLQARLTASDGAPTDFFGCAVAIAGDTVVVGAYRDNTAGGSDAGSAYIFKRSGTAWAQQAKLTAADGAAGDLFGCSVAIDGTTAVIGAQGDDTPDGPGAGSAYVFSRSVDIGTGAVSWPERDHLFASDGDDLDAFGFSVAIDGDRAVVGAVGDDLPSGADAGAAYVFERLSLTSWPQQKKLIAVDRAAGDRFGTSVAISGDYALVGAPQDDTSAGADAGSAYVFEYGPIPFTTLVDWSQQAQLEASDGATGDEFGSAVALDGDTAVVGAPGDNTSAGADSGSAHVFARAESAWTELSKLTPPGAGAGDGFGLSIALAGGTIVAGAEEDDRQTVTDAGSAHVYAIVALPPAVPTIVSVTEPSPGVARVTWTDNSPCETQFEFQRQSKPAGTWTGTTIVGPAPAVPGSGSPASWEQSPGSGSWRYAVRATNAAGSSAWTGYLVVTPAKPPALAAAWIAGGAGHNVKLTWIDNSGFEQGFSIQRQRKVGTSWVETTAVGVGAIGANATMFTDTTITLAGMYRYRIGSFNNGGSSGWTVWKTVTMP